ncbi:MAG: tryptophanase [bacterium]|nr:tryptophanase [bacterium]
MRFKLSSGKEIPVEMHKARMVQKVFLVPAKERAEAMKGAGYNTFLLKTKDIFLDMLTDSGVNAMSDHQMAGFIDTDDAYAGSRTFYEFADAVQDVLGYKYVMNVHQGRAAEHLLAKTFIKNGDVVATNYHFTTTRVHIDLMSGGPACLELYTDDALKTDSQVLFKGNMSPDRLKDTIKKYGKEKMAYVRMEASTNLIGGQPFSMANYKEITKIAKDLGILTVLDGSLICENAYMIKEREKGYENKTVAEIVKELCSLVDIYYMSGRKNTCCRGGCIATNNKELFDRISPWLPAYEGFYTYGGMSQREVGMMAVGMREMTDPEVAGCSVEQVRYFVGRLKDEGIPVVTPPGALGCHIDARKFAPHIPKEGYIAGAVTAALYIASGIRAMERGTVSMERNPDGSEAYADVELTRIAVPRRVYTMSQLEYAVDRVAWLHKNRELIGGLTWKEEPPVLRFFVGKLDPINDWGTKLAAAFKKDFGDKI